MKILHLPHYIDTVLEVKEVIDMKKLLAVVLAVMTVMILATGCKSKGAGAPNTIKDGKNLKDVVAAVDAKFTEKYGEGHGAVMMATPIDDLYLKDIVGLNPELLQEKVGNYALSMTNSDVFLAVKAKEGKISEVTEALNKHKADVEAQYEHYNVMGSYDRAKAGEVYVKGEYAFLLIVGPIPEDDSAPKFSEDVAMAKQAIDEMFN